MAQTCLPYCLAVWVCLSVYGAITYGLYESISMIKEGSEYANNGSEEQCEIIQRYTTSCTYKSGNTYYTRSKYAYEAIAPSKCGDQTLFSHRMDDDDCPGKLKDIGSKHKCYVLDCAEEEFTFKTSNNRIGWARFLVIVMVGCFCCPCCIILCAVWCD